MNEGWSAARVVTVVLLVLLLGTGWLILLSLDRAQEKYIEDRRKLEEVLRALGEDGTTVSPVEPPPAHFGDGKDAIGRPLRPSDGFTLEPPPGTEIPGRTVARTPDFIPPLGGTYVNAWSAEPDKYNHYLTNDGICQIYDRYYVHETLLGINPDDPQELWPELAVAWETGADKLTYRFHLRRGVVFSDGSPFGADDVLFSYNALMDPDVESEHLKAGYSDVESVRAVDDLTIEVRMRRRYWKASRQFGYNLRMLSREWFEREIPKMAARHGIEKWSVEPGKPGFAAVFNRFTHLMPPGTGPYMWREEGSWAPGQHFTLFPFMGAWIRKLNPDHYRLGKVRVRFIKDRIAQHEEFRKGRIDVLVVDHDKWDDTLSKDRTITSIAEHFEYDHMRLLYSWIVFNCRRPPFDDVRVRRAVAHLVDRSAILERIEKGRGRIATCPTKPNYPEYSHDIEPRAFDPDLARRILDEAGWRDTDGDGVVDKDGRPLTFRLSIPTGRTWFLSVSTMVEDACRSAGVRCEVDPKDWAVFLKGIFDREFDSVILYLSATDPWKDPYEEFHSSQIGPRAGNYSGWVNTEVDRLVETMREEFDDTKRAEMFHRLNHLFHEEVPALLLVHGKAGVLLNKRMQGAKVRPTGLRDFDIWIRPEDWRE